MACSPSQSPPHKALPSLRTLPRWKFNHSKISLSLIAGCAEQPSWQDLSWKPAEPACRLQDLQAAHTGLCHPELVIATGLQYSYATSTACLQGSLYHISRARLIAVRLPHDEAYDCSLSAVNSPHTCYHKEPMVSNGDEDARSCAHTNSTAHAHCR